MCVCEEEFARRFLPHQLNYGVELKTQRKIPVTLGFQKGICNTCRGLPEEAYPKAPMYGKTSKIVRYYWREIAFETIRRFGAWVENQGYTNWLAALEKHQGVYHSIEREVIREIKVLHQRSPKYVYQEESQNEVLTKHQVEVVRLDGVYVKKAEPGVAILDGDETCSPEEFTARHFERLGYRAVFTESVPFHALFGIFMWPLIQDPGDPKVRMVSFGDRAAFERGIKGRQICTFLPEDFGIPGYALRRVAAIEKHFALLPEQKEELLWVFDCWVEPSADLRQYLWAYRSQDINKARAIASIVSSDDIRRILKYLVEDYWGRYLGWPDMLVCKQDNYFFVEVKSSKDKLSENQKTWIRGNKTQLHLPFKLVKIHKLRWVT